MTKKDCLEILMTISALESWAFSFADKQRLPDWLIEDVGNCIDKLKTEILEEE